MAKAKVSYGDIDSTPTGGIAKSHGKTEWGEELGPVVQSAMKGPSRQREQCSKSQSGWKT